MKFRKVFSAIALASLILLSNTLCSCGSDKEKNKLKAVNDDEHEKIQPVDKDLNVEKAEEEEESASSENEKKSDEAENSEQAEENDSNENGDEKSNNDSNDSKGSKDSKGADDEVAAKQKERIINIVAPLVKEFDEKNFSTVQGHWLDVKTMLNNEKYSHVLKKMSAETGKSIDELKADLNETYEAVKKGYSFDKGEYKDKIKTKFFEIKALEIKNGEVVAYDGDPREGGVELGQSKLKEKPDSKHLWISEDRGYISTMVALKVVDGISMFIVTRDDQPVDGPVVIDVCLLANTDQYKK